jgi:hypothetical protein
VTTWPFAPLLDVHGVAMSRACVLEQVTWFRDIELSAAQDISRAMRRGSIEEKEVGELRTAVLCAMLTASLLQGMRGAGAAGDAAAAALELPAVEAELEVELAAVRVLAEKSATSMWTRGRLKILYDARAALASARRALRLLDAYLAQHNT